MLDTLYVRLLEVVRCVGMQEGLYTCVVGSHFLNSGKVESYDTIRVEGYGSGIWEPVEVNFDTEIF